MNDDDSDIVWAPATNVIVSMDFKTEDLVRCLKRNLFLFMLEIREKHCVPGTVQSSIVEDLHSLFD